MKYIRVEVPRSVVSVSEGLSRRRDWALLAGVPNYVSFLGCDPRHRAQVVMMAASTVFKSDRNGSLTRGGREEDQPVRYGQSGSGFIQIAGPTHYNGGSRYADTRLREAEGKGKDGVR